MSKQTTEKNGSNTDLYQRATEKVIKMLEAGTPPWRRTWGRYGMARNYVSGHVYSGINVLFLNLIAPYPIPYYLTWKQIGELNGRVKKGSKAEWVYFYKTYYKDANGRTIPESEASDMEDARCIRFLKTFKVFNIECVEGIEWELPEEVCRDNDPIEECEVILQELPEKPKFVMTDADAAFYVPATDQVNVPNINQFEDSRFYYRTTFHELSHWTGHESRLARPGIVERIDRSLEGYAEEELIAELSANYLCNVAGIDTQDLMEVSAGYLDSWVKRLKEDPKFLFRVAPKAQAATEFILGQKLSETLQTGAGQLATAAA